MQVVRHLEELDRMDLWPGDVVLFGEKRCIVLPNLTVLLVCDSGFEDFNEEAVESNV